MKSKQMASTTSVGRKAQKLVAILTVGLLFLAGVATLGAQPDDRDLGAIVDEVLQTQGVTSIENVNPDRVDPALLEELGEALMRQPARRGDESRAAEERRWMGYRYLRSGGERSWMGWGPGMMGPGMMGFGRSGAWNDRSWAGPDRGPWGPSSRMWSPGMMNGWGDYSRSQTWLPPWAWVLLAILLIVVAVLLILLFTRRGERKNRGGGALEILQNRYARGEITREEYDRIREVLE